MPQWMALLGGFMGGMALYPPGHRQVFALVPMSKLRGVQLTDIEIAGQVRKVGGGHPTEIQSGS